MKKIVIVVIVVAFVVLAFGQVANAQMAKEGTFAGTNSYAGTYKVTALDKDRLVISYENTGTQVEDSGQGPLHGMSTHNTGIQYIDIKKGVGKTMGYMTWMDKDGDKILWELTEDATQVGGPSSGTGKVIGGAGKFMGMEGSMEYTRRNMRPVADGTTQSIAKHKGSWKMVEAKQ
jgi:hypothetical protein